ncbi:MAG TPA: hypothetical protein DD979_08835 [Gammaproteobacteria bacterium]|jgi:ubiquinol-cytochrome c reductase iron-sulfur subunit|nr:hypothetical protein [Gammaproteobacteria bacterium]
MTSTGDTRRRRFLLRVGVKLMAYSVLAGIVWVGIGFVATQSDPKARLKTARISLATLAVGKATLVDWGGRPVVVLYRGAALLDALAEIPESTLRDPVSKASEQPASFDQTLRSATAQYFVAIAYGTDLGCPVRYLPPDEQAFQGHTWPGGFIDSCRGSRYDIAGRVYRQQQAQKNLVVPPHRIDGDTLVLGATIQ